MKTTKRPVHVSDYISDLKGSDKFFSDTGWVCVGRDKGKIVLISLDESDKPEAGIALRPSNALALSTSLIRMFAKEANCFEGFNSIQQDSPGNDHD